MSLMEISLLSKQLPGRLGLVGNHLGFGKLTTHTLNLIFEAFVLIINVGYKAYVVIVEGAFLLKFMPLLLEHI